jgi:WhiB family redox-sensing transcriptional regulator
VAQRGISWKGVDAGQGPARVAASAQTGVSVANPAWWKDGACVNDSAFLDFPKLNQTKEIQYSKSVCRNCSVRAECLAFAVINDLDEGIWGGTLLKSERQLMFGILNIPPGTQFEVIVDVYLG